MKIRPRALNAIDVVLKRMAVTEGLCLCLTPCAMNPLARRLVMPTCPAIAMATAEACQRPSSAVACYGGWKGGCALLHALEPSNP